MVQLADSTGTVTKTYAYDAFGNEKNIAANDTNPFRYSGEYYDKETGTIYLRARYYDPETGRFLAEDSFTGNSTDPLSLNLYAYCQNDPVNGIDPSGNIMLSVEVAKNQKAGIEWATAHPVENFLITADLASDVWMAADGAYEVKILVKGVPLVIKGIKAGSIAEAKLLLWRLSRRS